MYEIVTLVQFDKSWKKYAKRYRAELRRIEKAIDQLRGNPHLNDSWLRAELSGKHKKRVGGWRIVFAICEECRKLGHERCNKCKDCSSSAGRTVRLFDVGPRKDIYGGR